MKTFIPGTIARAEDVNTNFEELQTLINDLKNTLQTGTIGLGNIGPGDNVDEPITFPRAFTKKPVVLVQTGNQRLIVAAYDITPAGFHYWAYNNTSGISAATELMWLAIAL